MVNVQVTVRDVVKRPDAVADGMGDDPDDDKGDQKGEGRNEQALTAGLAVPALLRAGSALAAYPDRPVRIGPDTARSSAQDLTPLYFISHLQIGLPRWGI